MKSNLLCGDSYEEFAALCQPETIQTNFNIRTVQQLVIIKVVFIHQLMHQWVVLKTNI